MQACQVHLNIATLVADAEEAERHLRLAVALAERSGVPHLYVLAGQRFAEHLWAGERSEEAERVVEATSERRRARARTSARR